MAGSSHRSKNELIGEVEDFLSGFESPRFVLTGCREFHESTGSSRDPAYWLAFRVLQSSTDIEDRISAIALFLREWNRPFYTRGRPGTKMADIERDVQYALKRSSRYLRRFGRTSIQNFDTERQGRDVRRAFSLFSKRPAIGDTGAAKSLHIILPDLFPPWDNRIRSHYHRLHPGYWQRRTYPKSLRCSDSADCYLRFVVQVQKLIAGLRQKRRILRDHPLRRHFGFRVTLPKVVDECNYQWITAEEHW